MFNYIKNIYNNLYNRLLVHERSIKSETETEYVERKLNIWKVKMYSENIYLAYIPEKRILAEINRLKKEYNEK